MRTASLTAKYCKHKAMYFKRIVPRNRDEKITYEAGVPFYIGFIRSDNQQQFNVPNIRTIDTEHTIHTFRDLDVKTMDRIRFDNKDYYVEDTNYSYYESTQNKLIKQFFMTIK